MSFCGTGGWTGPLPGDPDNNSILSATPAFGGIDVSYSYPTTNAHAVAHALLYRGLTPVFSQTITSVVMPGNTYYDKVDSANQYYYWIRIVSTNGTVGDPIGPATAVARPLIQDLIVQLTGQIDSGVLAQSLKADLDKITLNYGEMIDEIANRVQGDAALSAALASVQEGLVSALAFIDSEVTARMTSQGALIEQVDTVAALNQDTAALLSQVQTAMVDGQAALAERIDQIAVTGEAAGAAAIDEQRLASIARDEALALAITSAEARIGEDVAQVETTLSTNVNLVGDKVNAIGALYTAKVKVNGLIGGFGVYNDGTEVQAGFDVDNFWIGRTGASLKKPFMVIGNETFIDQAAINELVITKLRDESGRLVMENGSLAIRNTLGEIIFSAGRALDWNYIGGATKPQDGATVGANETNLTVGIGANLLVNSDLAVNASSWALGWNESGVQDITAFRNHSGPDWQAVGTNNYGVSRSGTPTGVWDVYNTSPVPVVPGQRYEVSAYMASHRCQFSIGLVFYDSAGNHVLVPFNGAQSGMGGGKDLANWTKVFAFATAPAGARYVRLIFRSHATGEANPYTWITQPFLGVAGAAQTTPSPWSASNFSERITPANASTWIDANSINNTHIGGDLLSTNYISSGGTQGWVLERSGNIYANSGNFRGAVNTGAYTGYAWPAAGQYGAHLSASGLLIGNANNGKYFQVTSEGNIYAPGFNVQNGVMSVTQADVINTLNLAGNSVSVMNSVAGSADVSTSVWVPAGQVMRIMGVGIFGKSGSRDFRGTQVTSISIDGVVFEGSVDTLSSVNYSTDQTKYRYPSSNVINQVDVSGGANGRTVTVSIGGTYNLGTVGTTRTGTNKVVAFGSLR